MTSLDEYQPTIPDQPGCAEIAAVLENRRRYGMEETPDDRA